MNPARPDDRRSADRRPSGGLGTARDRFAERRRRADSANERSGNKRSDFRVERKIGIWRSFELFERRRFKIRRFRRQMDHEFRV